MHCPWMDVWLAAGGDKQHERKEILRTMVPGTAKKCKICLATKNGDVLEQNIFVICENDMLWNRNLGLKMGVSSAAHT